MADLNALIAQGAQFNLPNPVDQYSKVMQLQAAQQQMQTQRQQMQQIQEDRAGFAKLRETLADKNLTPEQYELALINSPSKDHQRMGLELRSRRNLLAEYDKAQKESGAGVEPPMAPAEVPAPMAAPVEAPKREMFVAKDSSGRPRYVVDGAEVSPQDYQSAQSGVVVGATPAAKPIGYELPVIDNALAARVAPAEPVANAMLAQPPAAASVGNAMASKQAQIAEINKQLKIATSPRFAEVPNIDKEIARLERQLKQLTENKYHVVDGNLVDETGKAIFTATPKPPSLPTVATMQALGFPLTQAGFNAYFDAQRQDRLLTPEEEAQKARIAAAGRAPAAPRPEPAPSITNIVDPTNPNQMIAIDAKRYRGGGVGSPGVIGVGGKEPGAALRVNKVEAGKTQLADDLDNLRSSFRELDRLRAIPSTERNVASNLMSAAQATGVGQALGRAGGTKEQVERDVINSARQRLVASIKNATGMSSKSLDSNMELQTMLRSISDPGQSVEAALRIIQDIEDAYVTGDGAPPKRDRPAALPAASQGTGGFKYLGKE
jgi:hypothetical protein